MTRYLSHETIYQYIWRDKSNGDKLCHTFVSHQNTVENAIVPMNSCGRLADKRHISERPAIIEICKYKGHWEIDTIQGRGSNHCIVTLSEWKAGFVMIGKLLDKSIASLNKKSDSLDLLGSAYFKTITADNSTEFHQYKKFKNVMQ